MIQEGLSTSTVCRGLKCSKRYRVIFVAMNVQKEYKRGGFFGNSQDKFSDMEGAGQGVNMAFGSLGILGGKAGGKGRAIRREKRYLKKLDRQGKLNEYGPRSMDRLDYLRNVQKDRAKKGIGAGALAAGAILGGPAALAAIKAKGAAAAGAKAAGAGAKKGGLKGLLDLFGKARKARKAQQALGESGFFGGMGETPGSDVYGAPGMDIDNMELGEIDEFGNEEEEGFEMGGKMRLMKQGGLVGGQKRLDKNNDGKISKEDFELLRAMFGAKLPR